MALALVAPAIDAGLAAYALANKIVICSTVPTTYTEANVTYKLGTKDFGIGGVFGSIAAGSIGRQISSTAVTDGTVSTNGTPVCWAVLDDANSRLLASGPMTGAAAVTTTQKWKLDSFTILVPGVIP